MTQRKTNDPPLTAFEGALFGVLAGERLGARVQGFEHRLVARRFDAEGLAALEPGPAGAATLMTVAQAESLVSEDEFYAGDFASRLAQVYDPERGFGAGTARVLERLREGEHWKRAAQGPGGRGSFGNGAAVRSAPIGLLYSDDVDKLRWTAEEAAEVTHDHALGIEGAVMQAFAVALASRAYGRIIDGRAFLRSTADACGMREFRARYRTAAELMDRKTLATKVVVERLGNANSALGSVATAAFCYASHPDSFERAVLYAVSLGGSSCAIASMTGAIAGAALGVSAIPERWLAGADLLPRLGSAAAALHAKL